MDCLSLQEEGKVESRGSEAVAEELSVAYAGTDSVAYSDDHGLLPFRKGQFVDFGIELIVPPAKVPHTRGA